MQIKYIHKLFKFVKQFVNIKYTSMCTSDYYWKDYISILWMIQHMIPENVTQKPFQHWGKHKKRGMSSKVTII